VKDYPALDVRAESADVLLAAVDQFGPTAVEERGDIVRVFFPTAAIRNAACASLAGEYDATAVEVSDEDWARRSQEHLPPIEVGRVTIVGQSSISPISAISSIPSIPNPPQSAIRDPQYAITITIPPSMGFGTGHHATTRLCLAALQDLDLNGVSVLDVGTGSGVLAIAADLLGATCVAGIDYDEDAIQAARENLPLNPAARHVTFDVADLATAKLMDADVVLANLTGALLVRAAPMLVAAIRPGGHLILSGILAHERDDVVRAMAPATAVRERREDEWIGLTMKK
jgi:ribosomal protein L11 methyltransferase